MSNSYRPGDTLYSVFNTAASTGAATDADTLPTAVMCHDGVTDATATVAVTHRTTGSYYASSTIPASYTPGDEIAVEVSAVMSGTTFRNVILECRLVGFPPTALPNASAGSTGGVPLGDASGRTNVGKWFDHAVTLDGNGLPSVNAADWNGSSITTGLPNSGTVSVGGYSLGQDPATLILNAALPTSPAAGTAGEALKLADTRLDATVSSRLAASAYAAPQTPAQIAAAILKTPANLLATDSAGLVTYNNAAPPTAAQIQTYLDTNSTQFAAILSGETTLSNAVANITTNSARTVFVVPPQMQVPTSGVTIYELDLILFDLHGQNEAADSPPTVHARNAAGTVRDDHLGSTTMTAIGGATGRYKVAYTVQSTDPSEGLIFDFTAVVSGVSRTVSGSATVSPFFASTFTATDRATLATLPTLGQIQGGLLATPGHPIANDASGYITYNNAAPPTASAIATAVLTDASSSDEAVAGSLGHLVTTGPGWFVAPPSTSAIAAAAAAAILASPTHPIATDGTGAVTYNNPSPPSATAIATAVLTDATLSDEAAAGSLGHIVTAAPGWYAAPPTATAMAVATAAAILKTPANLLATDSAGLVTYNNAAADTPGTATLLARVPGTVQPQSGDAFARLGAPAGASHAADVAAVAAKTANLPADPASNTVVNTRLAASAYAAPPTAQAVAQAVLTDTVDTATPGSLGAAAATIAANLDANVSSRSTFAGGMVAGVAAPVTVGTVNDKSGYSLVGGVTIAAYAAGLDPASLVLANPAQKLTTDTNGNVTLAPIIHTGATIPMVSDKSGYALASAGLDDIAIEPGVNARQALAPILAAAAGTLSGAGTGTIVVRAGASAPTATVGSSVATAAPATRIVATTDSSGNRSSVALYLPA